jgi:hypothetical protein
MKLPLLAGCALACLMLAGCGSTGVKVLDNVSNDCARKYDGTISAGITGGQFTGTVKIDCQPHGAAAGVAVASDAAAGATP